MPRQLRAGQQPLIIIDGVVTDTNLNDLAPLDIESVEVVKGAAGASLYGSRAANGVLQIRTKRAGGFAGENYSRLSIRNEVGQERLYGRVQLSRNHPWMTDANGALVDVNGDIIPDISDPLCGQPGAPRRECLHDVSGRALAKRLARLRPSQSRVRSGQLISNYGAVEGRNGATSYRGSFERSFEAGILPRYNDGFLSKRFRLNVDHRVRNNLNASISTSYSQGEHEAVAGDPFYLLTFMAPYADLLRRDPGTIGRRHCPENGCLYRNPDPLSNEVNPLYEFELVDDRAWLESLAASVNTRWDPASWMNVEGVFGFDRRINRGTNITPPGMETFQGGIETGRLTKYQGHGQHVNVETTASFTKAFGGLSTRTRDRYVHERENFENVNASGTDFVSADLPRLNNLDPESYSAGSHQEDVVSEGYFLISALDYNGKYIVDGLVRRDGSSLFGENQRWHTYYRGSLAWRLAQEGWWPLNSVNEFKIRFSIGTAGTPAEL